MSDATFPLEVAWALSVNGVRLAIGSSSPNDWAALGAGWLVGEAVITRPAELLTLAVEELESGAIHIKAQVDETAFERAREERRHREETACGLHHFLHCAPGLLGRARLPVAALPDGGALLLKSLFAACSAASPAGGVHGATLSDGTSLLNPAIDVSRHSAVQRAIGAAFLAGSDLSQLGLALTARVSGPIAATAARAGLAWVVSRSIPTSLAAAIAERAGLPILARSGGKSAERLGA